MLNEMLLGRTCSLAVARRAEQGYYLEGLIRGQRTEVLLPNGEVDPSRFPAAMPDGTWQGEAEVFIYLDAGERATATMRRPLAQVGDFACLTVAWVNNFGAFLAWGLMKDLFVPFSEQKMKMQKGQAYIVHLHVDPATYRIVASAKVERYLDTATPPYRPGDEVEILIWQKTDLGMKAIVDNRYAGLLYQDQIFTPLTTGQRRRAYVSQVRPDGKIDLTLTPAGGAGVQDFATVLHERLQEAGGRLPLGDKSPAGDIYAAFGVSKKVFKKALGDLYRQRLVTLTPTGVELTPVTRRK